jgi:1,2-phenylacetyl-CoA epoxidase catalytic subunit
MVHYNQGTKMKTSKEFVSDLRKTFDTLYNVADKTTREYFSTNPSNEELMGYFKIRLFNERWNMVELSQAVANAPVDTPMDELQLLAKQAYDEANHFRMVKEVVEHISGVEADLAELAKTHGKKMPSQGVFILDKYNAQGDELVLALYQFLAEGRASVVWQAMADSIEDDYVSSRYAKIARDERFHSEIGRLKLEKLCTSPEAQARALEFANKFVWDLYENTCLSIAQVSEEGRTAMKQTYGMPTRELAVAL